MKKLIYITQFIIFGSVFLIHTTSVHAIGWEKKEAGDNILFIEGSCDKADITIYLYPKDKTESVYSGSAECKDGKFSLKDDLGYWNLPKGEYKVVVGESGKPKDMSKQSTVIIKERLTPTPQISSAKQIVAPIESSQNQNNTSEDATDPLTKSTQNVLKSISNLKDSVEDFRQNVDKSSISQPGKIVLTGMLAMLDEKIAATEEIFDQIFSKMLGLFSNNESTSVPIPTESVTPSITPSVSLIASPSASLTP